MAHDHSAPKTTYGVPDRWMKDPKKAIRDHQAKMELVNDFIRKYQVVEPNRERHQYT